MRSAALASRDCVADSCAHSLSVTASAASSRRRSSRNARSVAVASRRVRRGVALFRAPRHALPAVGHFARERGEAAERVDEAALRRGFAERLVRVLAVDLDEPLAEFLQAARAWRAGR